MTWLLVKSNNIMLCNNTRAHAINEQSIMTLFLMTYFYYVALLENHLIS